MTNNNCSQQVPDLTDSLNVIDDLTGEPLFTLSNSKYYDFEEFLEISSKDYYTSGFSVVSINIRSLGNKMSSLINLLSLLPKLPTVICIQEIWSGHGDLTLPGFQAPVFYSRHADKPNPNCGGGVAIYIANGLNYQEIRINNTIVKGIIESVWVKIETSKTSSRIIGSVYRPNTAPLADPINFISHLSTIVRNIQSNSKKSKLYICGDYNLDLLKHHTHQATDDFISSIYDNTLLPLITKPTRITHNTATLIDNILTDNLEVTLAGILSLDLSDHEAVFAIDNIDSVCPTTQTTTYRDTSDKNLAEFTQALASTNFTIILNEKMM